MSNGPNVKAGASLNSGEPLIQKSMPDLHRADSHGDAKHLSPPALRHGSKVQKAAVKKSLGDVKHFSQAVKKQTVDVEQNKCTV